MVWFIPQNQESKLQTKYDVDFFAKISKDEMRKKAPETHCTCGNGNNPMVWFIPQNQESKLQTKYDVDFSA